MEVVMLICPQTLAEAQEYRYQRWAGNSEGYPYKPERCAFEVFPTRGLHYQCCRKPGHGPAQLYCRQHAKIEDVFGPMPAKMKIVRMP